MLKKYYLDYSTAINLRRDIVRAMENEQYTDLVVPVTDEDGNMASVYINLKNYPANYDRSKLVRFYNV